MARARPPWSSGATHLAPETPLPRRPRGGAFLGDDGPVPATPRPTGRRDPSPLHAIAAATPPGRAWPPSRQSGWVAPGHGHGSAMPPRRRAPGAATSPSRSAAVRETREGTGDANPGASAALPVPLVESPRTQTSRTTPTMARSGREQGLTDPSGRYVPSRSLGVRGAASPTVAAGLRLRQPRLRSPSPHSSSACQPVTWSAIASSWRPVISLTPVAPSSRIGRSRRASLSRGISIGGRCPSLESITFAKLDSRQWPPLLKVARDTNNRHTAFEERASLPKSRSKPKIS